MKGLLVKDFRLMFQRKGFFCLLFLIAAIMLMGSEANMVIAYLVMVCTMFLVSTVSYDEYDKCYAFLFTLPVDRKTYVIEKYLLGIILGMISWAGGSLLYLVIQGVQHNVMTNVMVCTQTLIYISLAMLINDITLPFQLKYGMERGRLAMFLCFGGVAGIVYLIKNVLAGGEMAQSIHSGELFLWIQQQPNWLIALYLAAAILIVTYLSYRISLKIMCKKEL